MLGYNKWKKLNEDLGSYGGAFGGIRNPNVIGKVMGRVAEIGDDPIDADHDDSVEFSQVDMGDDQDGGDEIEEVCIRHPKYGIVCGERVSDDESDDDSDDMDDEDSGEMGDHNDDVEEVGEEELDGPEGEFEEIEDETPMESTKYSKKKCWGKMSKSKSKKHMSKMDDGDDDDDNDMEESGSSGANMKKKMKSGQVKGKGCMDGKKSCGSGKMESATDYLKLPPMNEWRQSIASMLNPNEKFDGMNIITEKRSNKNEEEHEEHEKREDKMLKKGEKAIQRNDMDHEKILKKLKDLYAKLPKRFQAKHKKQCDM